MAGEWILKDDWAEIDGLKAEVERLERDLASRADAHKRTIRALIGSSAECDALRLEVTRLTAERDAWSDEAVKMLRQRNVLLEWARERAGFACGHDVMVAAGLAAPPADDPAVAGLVAAFGLPTEDAMTDPAIDPETLDCPQFGASEGDTHDG